MLDESMGGGDIPEGGAIIGGAPSGGGARGGGGANGGGAGGCSMRGPPGGPNCPEDISLRCGVKLIGAGAPAGGMGAPAGGMGGGPPNGGGPPAGCCAFSMVPRLTRCCLTSPTTNCTSKLSGLALAISSRRKKIGLSPARSLTCSTWASRLFNSASGFKFSGLTLLSYTSRSDGCA
jgi:hypothetical protein